MSRGAVFRRLVRPRRGLAVAWHRCHCPWVSSRLNAPGSPTRRRSAGRAFSISSDMSLSRLRRRAISSSSTGFPSEPPTGVGTRRMRRVCTCSRPNSSLSPMRASPDRAGDCARLGQRGDDSQSLQNRATQRAYSLVGSASIMIHGNTLHRWCSWRDALGKGGSRPRLALRSAQHPSRSNQTDIVHSRGIDPWANRVCLHSVGPVWLQRLLASAGDPRSQIS